MPDSGKRAKNHHRRAAGKPGAEDAARVDGSGGLEPDGGCTGSEAYWRSIFEHMHEGFALCEIIHGPDGVGRDFRYIKVNQAWERLTGIPTADTIGRLGSEVFPGLERFWFDTYAQVAASGDPTHFEYRTPASGQWFEVFAFRTEPGRFATLFLDISDRKASEDRMLLLASEVDHRAKNALTMVQAVLRLTDASDLSSYRRNVEGRVRALARAQDLLTANKWQGADLRALFEAELSPFLGSTTGPRATLDGPSVMLPSTTTQPVAMAVHELTTNAVKHGALSVRSGHVAASWSVAPLPAGVLLRLRWAENGGPAVAGKPDRQGFGSRVLERTIKGQLGGGVSLAWTPSGLVCDMEVPLKPQPQRDAGRR